MINNFTICYLICLHCYFSIISFFIHLVNNKEPQPLDGVIDTMYHADHHSKDRYLHNNKIVVAKIRLGMVVMLELEPPSIHILPQHETHTHSYSIPKSNMYTHRYIVHLNIMLNYYIIMPEFLLAIKAAAWACRNISPINISA